MQKKNDDMQKYTYEFLKDKIITSNLFSLSNIILFFSFSCGRYLESLIQNWTKYLAE